MSASEKAQCEAEVLADLLRLRPVGDDDDPEERNVLWWRVPIVEPPYVGTALDDDFPAGWATHWSPLPEVEEPAQEVAS